MFILKRVFTYIPWQVFVLIGIVFIFFLWGHIQFQRGEHRIQKLWDISKIESETIIRQLQREAQEVTKQIEIRYVDRITTIREKADVIIREIPIYIPADACELPGGFRLLHDAAATNTIPEAARIPYAASVGVREATQTITGNYKTCHEIRATLMALQDWVREQHRLSQIGTTEP